MNRNIPVTEYTEHLALELVEAQPTPRQEDYFLQWVSIDEIELPSMAFNSEEVWN